MMKSESFKGGYMKNLLKKNQIIITALAIMIAIAGYLNLTKESVTDKKEKLDDQIAQAEEYETFSEQDLLSENETAGNLFEISDEDNMEDGTYEVTNSGSGDMILAENKDNDAVSSTEEEAGVPGEAILASTTISGD